MKPDLYEALTEIATNRKSTRSFSKEPVPNELIDKILKIANTSPYASGRTNWGIKVINDAPTIQQVIETVKQSATELSKDIWPGMQEDFLRYSSNFTAFNSAPVLLVPYCRVSPALTLMIDQCDDATREWERDSIIKSISCVAMLILMAAESLDLGACYNTGALLAEDKLAPLLGVPNGRRIGAIIPIGYKKGKKGGVHE